MFSVLMKILVCLICAVLSDCGCGLLDCVFCFVLRSTLLFSFERCLFFEELIRGVINSGEGWGVDPARLSPDPPTS